jgi:long-chain acyl-CoA synthetase
MKILGNPLIEQACVVGTGVPQPIVLITLTDAAKQKSHVDLVTELTSFINTVNADLEKYEVIEKIVIIKENWTISNNLLTPSMKVKRNEVEKIHLPKYPTWYEEKDKVVWEK